MLERKEKKIEPRTRIPFKIQFSLDEKVELESKDILQILGRELLSNSRVDIQGVIFPVESVFDYDEIEDLTIHKNAAFKNETQIYIVPTPGLIYVQTNSDQYIITGYLIKYENNK
ncbi:hypothetical protein ND861_01035 [Leptospira sp. 2 VSF19]|uniref:Uncharacterized protein n=1 Tax=Leptospira soteropolitanensis TaxID=2950025 RepID=A0AAW5V7F1_9LEPT|nr:hypothetical protein [Leptospira soteropolitanensis]MCW7491228.1 hypothetical protein [Leptospira soteropolitanensis]MCW7498812.1 hypothetical protein [Leptospira soteropolitanensis]MCW7521595.1 hypothetical protein [Leptospira soteropolitanensis]MCW7524916.1 hypothetical protein [Leptospira soteropolitanensis]MCW7528783.1 hypothetical protein [Leptospira soteropolitanensis]